MLAALLALAACGREQDPTVGAGGSTTTSGAPTTSGPPTTAASAGGAFATTTVSQPSSERGLLSSVQATHDGDVDRVTFTFEGARPGYRIGYADRPIVQFGSGEEVTVDGAGVLVVHFEPASGFDLTGEGRQVFKGPERLDLATSVVLDVVRVGDFEAQLAWAVGVDGAKVPFRVRTDTGPSRVILEVQAAG